MTARIGFLRRQGNGVHDNENTQLHSQNESLIGRGSVSAEKKERRSSNMSGAVDRTTFFSCLAIASVLNLAIALPSTKQMQLTRSSPPQHHGHSTLPPRSTHSMYSNSNPVHCLCQGQYRKECGPFYAESHHALQLDILRDTKIKQHRQWAEGQPCPSGWLHFNDSCYWGSSSPLSWFAAEHECRAFGYDAHLASVHSADENSRAQAIAGCGAIWIGLTKMTPDVSNQADGWGWTDMSDNDFSAWRPGNPVGKNDERDCAYQDKGAAVASGTGWANGFCTELRLYTCKCDAKINTENEGGEGESKPEEKPEAGTEAPKGHQEGGSGPLEANNAGPERRNREAAKKAPVAKVSSDKKNGKGVKARAEESKAVAPNSESPIPCPGGAGWLDGKNGYCYFYSSAKANWFEAESRCRNFSAIMLDVKEELDQRLAMLGGCDKRTWLGLVKWQPEDHWHWYSDMSPVGADGSYTNWAQNNTGANYVVAYMDTTGNGGGRWYDTPSPHEPMHYICKQSIYSGGGENAGEGTAGEDHGASPGESGPSEGGEGHGTSEGEEGEDSQGEGGTSEGHVAGQGEGGAGEGNGANHGNIGEGRVTSKSSVHGVTAGGEGHATSKWSSAGEEGGTGQAAGPEGDSSHSGGTEGGGAESAGHNGGEKGSNAEGGEGQNDGERSHNTTNPEEATNSGSGSAKGGEEHAGEGNAAANHGEGNIGEGHVTSKSSAHGIAGGEGHASSKATAAEENGHSASTTGTNEAEHAGGKGDAAATQNHASATERSEVTVAHAHNAGENKEMGESHASSPASSGSPSQSVHEEGAEGEQKTGTGPTVHGNHNATASTEASTMESRHGPASTAAEAELSTTGNDRRV